MRLSVLLLIGLSVAGTHASWFDSDVPPYTKWSNDEVKEWLKDHNIEAPSAYSHAQLQEIVQSNWNSASAWTADQYTNAQKYFQDVRDSSFDAWDESRLRDFLLEQGVVAPSGPREQLVLLAKQKYNAYTDAARSLSSKASASASTAVYGDSSHQVSKTVSSVVAQATKAAGRSIDDNKDYIYSTWDDNNLRSYLEEQGVLKTETEKKREELLAMMRDSYARVANPIWNAWSDSYIYEWLLSHGIIKSDHQKNRDDLMEKMNHYYYSINDSVWSTWSDSELKSWLVKHNIVKSDAQIQREKLIKLVENNYITASDTVWGAWTDSDIRAWVIEHGYMKSDAQAKREELVKLINNKYTDSSARLAAYLAWPDARLRAYLRERGVSEDALPTSRPGLLQEVRIRWVQTTTRTESLFNKIREIINGGVEIAEEKLSQILEILGGGVGHAKRSVQDAKEDGEKMAKDTRKDAGEKMKKGGEKVKGEL